MSKQRDALAAVIRLGRYLMQNTERVPTLTSTQLVACEALVPEWVAGNYAIGDIRTYSGQLWKCVQAHDSTANTGWTPDEVPALWTAYHTTNPNRAKAYVAPTGAQDAYYIGECIIWEGITYRCLVDATVHDPETLPSAWEVVDDDYDD